MYKRELSIEKEIEMLEVVRESEGILFLSKPISNKYRY